MLSTVYVDAGSAAAAPDGKAWGSAFPDLQSGLAAAQSGDTILVAAGTYKPTSGTDRTATFTLTNGVEIDGGYAGSANSANPNARDVVNTPTTLSGDIGTVGDNSDNSYHVVTGQQVNQLTILDGISITAGNANATGISNGNIGGGLLNIAGAPLVRNCTFTGNSASQGGGAIDSTIGSATLLDCTFTDNSAVGPFSAGGAVNAPNALGLQITGCRFTGNTANKAGAVYAFGQSVFVTETLTDCTFTRNSSATIGGAVLLSQAQARLVRCGFFGNSASQNGGGINIGGSTATYLNCVFSGNTSPEGAALESFSESATATNCTFVSSAQPDDIVVAFTKALALSNCVVAGDGIATSESTLSISYSDMPSSTVGTGNLSADPHFVRNPGPGPDGKWGTTDDDYGDLHLQKTSPAIDAGDNSAVPAGTTTDIAGNPRFFNVGDVADTGHGTAPIVDMGAYEAQFASALTPIAKAGGPYSVVEGGKVTLDGGASSEAGGSIASYAWDFNYDGNTFTADASGKTASFSAAGIDGPAARTVALRVTDSLGHSAIASTTVNITDVSPTAKLTGGTIMLGSAGSVAFSGAADPSPADVTAGFKYSFDFNNDGTFEITDATSSSATVPASFLLTAGAHTIRGRIKDKDGGFTTYTTTIQVNAPASISGTVFKDANANGTLESGEAGLAGRTVYIDKNKNGKFDNGEATTITAANGTYSFKNVLAGSYRIADVTPAGWRQTAPLAGFFDLTVASGQIISAKNFGQTQNVLISGSVFNDANSNAARDASEKGIAGRTIYIDKNKNGKLDAGEPTTLTAADGTYAFKTLAAGSYRIAEVLPAGWRRTIPTAGYFDVTLTAGQTASGKVFGETTTALISGTVFKDSNSNGKQDVGELGLAGWVVYLDANNNGKLDSGEVSTTTDSKGNYRFVVVAGKYNVREILKSGFTRTTPTTGVYAMTLTAGQAAAGKNFGDR
ncbi:MAG TPA: SdrD B-like domain-containing protein [Humisphaera sp.]|nr:SdrD B-like domain-containing protein [Humisphaera sp.]